MAGPTTTPDKQSDQQTSGQIAAAGRDLAAELDALFNDPESGAYVQGVVVTVEEPELREGRNDKGRPYRFFNRRIQLQTKDGAMICAESHDEMKEFRPIQRITRVKWPIQRARMDGSQMVFNVLVV